MAEYPEIANLTRQLGERLSGCTITAIEVMQPKCLNMTPSDFSKALVGANIQSTNQRGKWIQIKTNQGWLLLNLGMGGELLVVTPDKLPEKRRVVFTFDNNTCLSVNFWWFGYTHFAEDLQQHEMTARLGANALELTQDEFHKLVIGQRGGVKAFLLDQTRIAGIGNAYIHDILFLAHLHPLHKIDNFLPSEIDTLYQAIQKGLVPSLEKGGAFYEKDTYGNPGRFTFDEILVGYKEGRPCPVCSTPVAKIKTGSTASFICPHCQV